MAFAVGSRFDHDEVVAQWFQWEAGGRMEPLHNGPGSKEEAHVTDRFLHSWFAVISVIFLTFGPAAVQGQDRGQGAEAPPRTAWGAPD